MADVTLVYINTLRLKRGENTQCKSFYNLLSMLQSDSVPGYFKLSRV